MVLVFREFTKRWGTQTQSHQAHLRIREMTGKVGTGGDSLILKLGDWRRVSWEKFIQVWAGCGGIMGEALWPAGHAGTPTIPRLEGSSYRTSETQRAACQGP